MSHLLDIGIIVEFVDLLQLFVSVFVAFLFWREADLNNLFWHELFVLVGADCLCFY